MCARYPSLIDRVFSMALVYTDPNWVRRTRFDRALLHAFCPSTLARFSYEFLNQELLWHGLSYAYEGSHTVTLMVDRIH